MKTTTNFGLKKPELSDDYEVEDITGDMETVRKLLGQQNIMGAGSPIISVPETLDNISSDWNVTGAAVYRHRSGQIALKIIFNTVTARNIDSRGFFLGNTTIAKALPEWWPMSTIGMRSWAFGRTVRGYLANNGGIAIAGSFSQSTTLPANQSVELMSDWYYPASAIGQLADIRIPNGGEAFDGSALNEYWKKIESYEAKSPVFAKGVTTFNVIDSPTSPDTYGILNAEPNNTTDYKTKLSSGSFTVSVIGDRLYLSAAITRTKVINNLSLTDNGDIGNQNYLEITPALIDEINRRCGTAFTGIRMGGKVFHRVSFNTNFRADFVISGSSDGVTLFSHALDICTTTAVTFPYTFPNSITGNLGGWIYLA